MKLAALLLVLTYSSTAWGAVNDFCAHSKGVEPDITVHGRLAVYNGGYPNLRLWHVGTRHLYGIYSDSKDLGCLDKTACYGDYDWTKLPLNVQRLFNVQNPFNITVYGDFLIRTLVGFKAGSMQAACIVSAEHLVRRAD